MPNVIRLYHPGGERRLIGRQNVREGRCPWATNDNKHARKFLFVQGQCVQNIDSNVQAEQLMFWGEWEPPSNYTRLDYVATEIDELPYRIHTPVIEPVENRRNLLNTDPYVFGDHFYYSCCLQNRFERLRTLESQSLILFGAYKETNNDGGNFYLDTVFVVDKQLSLIANTEECRQHLTATAYEAIIAPHAGSQEVANSQLYSGISHHANHNLFSYFPCKIIHDNEKPFARIPIAFTSPELQHLGLTWSNMQKQGYTGCLPVPAQFAQQVWQAVTERLLAAGLCLGIYAQEPVLPNQVP